ncbi:MAG: hypothetical protein DRQ51_10325 [Gammaproteobacteria bacterium]|nr:MAG: hypothetical protein DRQ51_10325 [Gammaproteobacteria bacterium]
MGYDFIKQRNPYQNIRLSNNKTIMRILFILFFFILLTGTAHSDSLLCPAPQNNYDKLEFIKTDNIELDADYMEKIGNNFILNGNTRMTSPDRNLYSDRMTIKHDKTNPMYKLDGNVKILSPSFLFATDNATFNPKTNNANLTEARFQLRQNNLRGSTGSITKKSPYITILKDASITSCPPAQESWRILGSTIKIDTESQEGSVTHFRLLAGDIPIFYLPYFRFPLTDDRKTGFLYPSFAYDDRAGFITNIPYYFNILPNLDDTLTARNYAKRGLMAQNELRFLMPFGRWQLDNEFLENDKLTDTTRKFSHFAQHIQFTDNIWLETDTSTASDKNYFSDFGNTLALSQLTHLEQRTDLNLKVGDIFARVRALDYQTLDESIALENRPYKLLPEFLFSYDDNKIAKLYATHTSFFKSDKADAKRAIIKPKIFYNYQLPGFFVKPAVKVHMASYAENFDDNNTAQTNESLNVPTTSLDTGLIFDNYLDNKTTLLTLEPRLFLVNTPYVRQEHINIYDTSVNEMSIAQLFRTNRYSGYDRVQDTRQMTAALTHKNIDISSGKEIYSTTVGQIFYGKDREVTLPNEGELQQDKSDLLWAADINYPNNFTHRLYNQYNQDNKINTKQSYDIQYKPSSRLILNAGYAEEYEVDEQINLSASVPIGYRWSLFGRYNKSLDKEKELMSMAGFEYNSCCYKLQTMFTRHININTDESDYKFYVQWTLKGVSNIGQNTHKILSDNIIGY